MNDHANLQTDTLYLRGDNGATVSVQKKIVEELSMQGCEVCGRNVEDLARIARPEQGPYEIVLNVMPCEDTDAFEQKYGKTVDVHVVCTRCRLHPLVLTDDLLGVVRCLGALTEADRTMIALWEIDRNAR